MVKTNSSEEPALRRLLPFIALIVLAMGAPAFAADVPEIPFDSTPNFLKLPTDMYLGEASGVAVNSKHQRVFVFSRGNTTGPAYAATAAQLLEFGPDGKFLREIGKNLYAWSFAHDVKIDKDDNIWAIDKGSRDMVIGFNPEGRVTMLFGHAKKGKPPMTMPRRGSIRIRRCRRLTASSASRRMSRGTTTAISTSATVTSTHALRSTTKTVTG